MDKPVFKLVTFPEANAFLESLVEATHELVKKTRTPPKSEIKHARAIRKEYLESKDI